LPGHISDLSPGCVPARIAGLQASRQRRPAEVDFERTVDGLAALAHQSGLVSVQSRELTWD
jgi:hypothetical protein